MEAYRQCQVLQKYVYTEGCSFWSRLEVMFILLQESGRWIPGTRSETYLNVRYWPWNLQSHYSSNPNSERQCQLYNYSEFVTLHLLDALFPKSQTRVIQLILKTSTQYKMWKVRNKIGPGKPVCGGLSWRIHTSS